MLHDYKALLTALTILLLYGTAGSTPPLEDFIHPDTEIISLTIQLDDDRLISALYQAFNNLTALGGESILVCKFHRIEAPLGGYLFDGLINLEIEGANYTTFRIGIEDGESNHFFALIARGMDSNSNVIWYPAPGPDYVPEINQVTPEDFLTYEFLINRDGFENLENEFLRPETVDQKECNEEQL